MLFWVTTALFLYHTTILYFQCENDYHNGRRGPQNEFFSFFWYLPIKFMQPTEKRERSKEFQHFYHASSSSNRQCFSPNYILIPNQLEQSDCRTDKACCIRMPLGKKQILTWLGGICFPLRRSSKRVPKLYITLSGVTLPTEQKQVYGVKISGIL